MEGKSPVIGIVTCQFRSFDWGKTQMVHAMLRGPKGRLLSAHHATRFEQGPCCGRTFLEVAERRCAYAITVANGPVYLWGINSDEARFFQYLADPLMQRQRCVMASRCVSRTSTGRSGSLSLLPLDLLEQVVGCLEWGDLQIMAALPNRAVHEAVCRQTHQLFRVHHQLVVDSPRLLRLLLARGYEVLSRADLAKFLPVDGLPFLTYTSEWSQFSQEGAPAWLVLKWLQDWPGLLQAEKK